MIKDLTHKQTEIYDFIVKRQMSNGYPPTQDEIRNHFNFKSLNAVRSHLALIEKKGYIGLNSGKARGIRLASLAKSPEKAMETIPLFGSISAGLPIWAEQNIENHLPVSPDIFGGGQLFALHVKGDSMTGAGILNGDIAVIKYGIHVENGDIAAVLIGQEATLKRVHLSSGLLELKSENSEFPSMTFRSDHHEPIRILGRYQGIIRKTNR